MGGNSASLNSGGIIATGNIQVAPAGISGPIKWETQGSEFRYERLGPNGPIVFVSGLGNPALVDGNTVQRNIGHLAMNSLVPHLAVLALENAVNSSSFQIGMMQQTAVNSAAAIKISIVDETDDISSAICKQDWYLDPRTLWPLRVDFLNSDVHNALSTVKLTYVFSNYKLVSGVAIPFTVDTLSDDQQISEITFTSVQIGVPIPLSDFEATMVATEGAH